MKIITNLPEDNESIEELENRVAVFRATLYIQKIKNLNIDDASKNKIMELSLDYLNSMKSI